MSANTFIIGAGPGLSASLARKFSDEGRQVVLGARNVDKLKSLCDSTGAQALTCDVEDRASVESFFTDAVAATGTPDIVIYNPSFRARGAFVDLNPDDMQKSLQITAFGGYLVAREAVPRMLEAGGGAIFFTGASASVKGYPQSASFAMGKAALRGLAQSLARELGPSNIHVAHFVIDGGIRSEVRTAPADQPDSLLDPDAIAQTYWNTYQQPRSAWSLEVELRPFTERF